MKILLYFLGKMVVYTIFFVAAYVLSAYSLLGISVVAGFLSELLLIEIPIEKGMLVCVVLSILTAAIMTYGVARGHINDDDYGKS